MDIAKRFGEDVARLRRRAGLSQTELAKRAAMSREEIEKLERGEEMATLDVLIKLAGSLGISPNDLLARLGSRKRGG